MTYAYMVCYKDNPPTTNHINTTCMRLAEAKSSVHQCPKASAICSPSIRCAADVQPIYAPATWGVETLISFRISICHYSSSCVITVTCIWWRASSNKICLQPLVRTSLPSQTMRKDDTCGLIIEEKIERIRCLHVCINIH